MREGRPGAGDADAVLRRRGCPNHSSGSRRPHPFVAGLYTRCEALTGCFGYAAPSGSHPCRPIGDRLRRFSAMRRILTLLLALVLAPALAAPLVGPGAAQVDLGNDGVDLDCAYFPELNAAQGYFDADGGAPGRNVDNLDPTGDG